MFGNCKTCGKEAELSWDGYCSPECEKKGEAARKKRMSDIELAEAETKEIEGDENVHNQ